MITISAIIKILAILCIACHAQETRKENGKTDQKKKGPEVDLTYANNYYILLSSSKFFFNYRHSSNVLIFYKYLKDRGISDDKIILMLPENHACNARNNHPGTLFVELNHHENMYCDDIEVDYKAEDLTFESILNLMRGRYADNVSKYINVQEVCDALFFIAVSRIKEAKDELRVENIHLLQWSWRR